MTLPSYPAELPKPLQDGYQVARGDGRIMSRNDAGPPNIRGRYSAVVNTVQFSTFLSRSQLARFDRFYLDDTKRGSLPFLIPDPGTNGWPLLSDDGSPLLTDEGTPILLAEIWLVTFGGKLPVISNKATYWTVAFELTVLPT